MSVPSCSRNSMNLNGTQDTWLKVQPLSKVSDAVAAGGIGVAVPSPFIRLTESLRPQLSKSDGTHTQQRRGVGGA